MIPRSSWGVYSSYIRRVVVYRMGYLYRHGPFVARESVDAVARQGGELGNVRRVILVQNNLGGRRMPQPLEKGRHINREIKHPTIDDLRVQIRVLLSDAALGQHGLSNVVLPGFHFAVETQHPPLLFATHLAR
jgi:hypothetical protein